MKNSKNSLIIDIIVVVVLFGLIGGILAMVISNFNKISDSYDDLFNEIQNVDDIKFTLADGEIQYGLRQNPNYNLLVVYCEDLKPLTEYTVKWSLIDDYRSSGFNFYYTEDSGVNKPCILVSTSANVNGNYVNYISVNGSVSTLLLNEMNFTTTEEGYVEIGFLIADRVDDNDIIQEQMQDFVDLINYIEITEV